MAAPSDTNVHPLGAPPVEDTSIQTHRVDAIDTSEDCIAPDPRESLKDGFIRKLLAALGHLPV